MIGSNSEKLTVNPWEPGDRARLGSAGRVIIVVNDGRTDQRQRIVVAGPLHLPQS